MILRNLAACILALSIAPPAPAQSDCHYDSWTWDTVHRLTVGRERVAKAKSALAPEERGATPGCTVCEEDQVEVRAPGLPAFRVCRALRERFERALAKAQRDGFPIRTLVGYRVGRSKGPLDAAGLRTQFSHHSFGEAIDVNAELNGLYDDCETFGPRCRLLRGGARALGRAGTIAPNDALDRAFKGEGFKWGGELAGRQKDFMHFSLKGD